MTVAAVKPANFDRRHAVSEAQEKEWEAKRTLIAPLTELWPSKTRQLVQKAKLGLDNNSLWVPGCSPKYAPILNHGIRSETRGLVLHVNDGYAKGTEGFFTNGLREPYGSEGVGAHFEICGKPGLSIYDDTACVQFLPLNAEAWHAVDANGYTIGLEHAGFGYSLYEWETVHYHMIQNSAYRSAWILRRYKLGPPKVSDTYSSNGDHNVWPHHAGGASWGGHVCPSSTKNGVDYFPWELWTKYCNKAYDQKWMWK